MTERPAYGGILFPLAIGAVVDGVPSTFQTPLSGQMPPVDTRVPRGCLAFEAIGHTPVAICKSANPE